MKIDQTIRPRDLRALVGRVFDLGGQKVRAIDRTWNPAHGTPVFTVSGRYTTRGWTEWTQGFVYGCAILVFDATRDRDMLELGRSHTLDRMGPHVTHMGVHDHGFNNLSTYGNLRRLMLEGHIRHNQWEMNFYDLAIKASGAVQAGRWTDTADSDPICGGGYIYSFNGAHSLFVDTMRTIRILGLAHQLGHHLMGEGDVPINLLGRAIRHALTTARYIVFNGRSNRPYDIRGRTAHEAIFNRQDGSFRCRSTQQGYSPFSTWTRGLAWAMLGFAENLEFLQTLDNAEIRTASGLTKTRVMATFLRVARATCDHYIQDCSAEDGVCYWDDGAPNLHQFDWRSTPADPFNDFEPVDSSAAAIAAQGLIRLGRFLGAKAGGKYTRAGLTVARTLFGETYLSTSRRHQGLLMHSVYHHPNGWDHVPHGRKVPCGESSMWGDYHLLELANLVKRLNERRPYPRFFEV